MREFDFMGKLKHGYAVAIIDDTNFIKHFIGGLL